MIETQDHIKTAKEVLHAEAQALMEVASRFDEQISKAAHIILNNTGKLIISGMGKSGHVAQKMSATLSSTGTPSVYLHPAEALHGDLGIYSPGDPTILLSKSGTTAEIMRLIPTLRQFQSPIIAIVSNTDSPIAQQADVVIDAHVSVEADPLGIVPTSSALVSMAIGDALASVLIKARGFQQADFAKLHPAGQLGRNLLFKVKEVMHGPDSIAVATEDQKMLDVVMKMTQSPYGAACIVDDAFKLKGIITDGDIRKSLQDNLTITEKYAGELMTQDPICASEGMLLADALKLMEDRPSQISVLPVKDPGTQKLKGLLRIHDIYQS